MASLQAGKFGLGIEVSMGLVLYLLEMFSKRRIVLDMRFAVTWNSTYPYCVDISTNKVEKISVSSDLKAFNFKIEKTIFSKLSLYYILMWPL